MHRWGDYRVSVFLDPDPPRAGLVEVSVLLQDHTGKSVIDVPVTVKATPKIDRVQAVVPIAASATGLAGGLPNLWQPGLVKADPMFETMLHKMLQEKHSITAKASVTTSTNKMLLSAVLEIPRPGKWDFKVQIKPPTGTSFTIPKDVGEPLPAWMQYAGWVLWPLGMIVVFILHRTLVRWRQRKANPQPAPAEQKEKPKKARKGRK